MSYSPRATRVRQQGTDQGIEIEAKAPKQSGNSTEYVSTSPVDTARPRRRQHTEKLSDIGARIARVAHELNAPISLISGSLENLEQYVALLVAHVRGEAEFSHDKSLARLPDNLDLDYVVENAPALLRICRDATVRLNHVVQQLKGYTRRNGESGAPETVDAATILKNAITFAGQGREVLPTVHQDIPALLLVTGSAESLSQAFVNVISNAFDAVVGTPNPRVWLSARLDRADLAEQCRPHRVEVRVRDNGPGIKATDRRRIFEAFFTTKARGVGLGLGLAIAKEIVEAQGGTIELTDRNGPGAEFVVRLPVGGSCELHCGNL